MIRKRSPWYFALATLAIILSGANAQAKADDVEDNRPYKGSFDFATTHVEFLAPDTVMIVGDLAGSAGRLRDVGQSVINRGCDSSRIAEQIR